MILQAANGGGVMPFERYDDPQAFLFDPFLQVTQFDLKLAQFGFISFASFLEFLLFILAINLVRASKGADEKAFRPMNGRRLLT
jgi:hypothetical protein